MKDYIIRLDDGYYETFPASTHEDAQMIASKLLMREHKVLKSQWSDWENGQCKITIFIDGRISPIHGELNDFSMPLFNSSRVEQAINELHRKKRKK